MARLLEVRVIDLVAMNPSWEDKVVPLLPVGEWLAIRQTRPRPQRQAVRRQLHFPVLHLPQAA